MIIASETPSSPAEKMFFSPEQIAVVDSAISMAEELVSDFFKLSVNQWRRTQYDIRTLENLAPDEIVHGPFAQVLRFEVRPQERSPKSPARDFYKICLQDHAILPVLRKNRNLELFPFSLYIVTHELIHIVRFSRFLQHFDASPEERMAEEIRVHEHTREILSGVRLQGLEPVFEYYRQWREAGAETDRY